MTTLETASSLPWTSPMDTALRQDARVRRIDGAEADRIRRDYYALSTTACLLSDGALVVEMRTVDVDGQRDATLDEWNLYDVTRDRAAACHRLLDTLNRDINFSTVSRGVASAHADRMVASAAVAEAQGAFEAARDRCNELVRAGEAEYVSALKRARILGKARRNEAPADVVSAIRADVRDKCGPAIEAARREADEAERDLDAAKKTAARVRRGELTLGEALAS